MTAPKQNLGQQQQRQDLDGLGDLDQVFSRLPSETSQQHKRRLQQCHPFPAGEMDENLYLTHLTHLTVCKVM